MEQDRAPLYEALCRFRQQQKAGFHVPGHGSGQAFDLEAKHDFLPLLTLDQTEVGKLDDLHQPQGAISDAQQLAAQLFGAEETFFLVNGTTVGILALILSSCQRGEKILIQRNAHKSLLHGCLLAGCEPVFLTPTIDPQLGVAGGVTLAQVEAALQQHPDVKAVFLMRPNYYGMGFSLREIGERVHRCGKPLFIDEAHGGHFAFHPAWPDSALAEGADAVVQSTHKTLPAMTMGSMLHIRQNRVDRDGIRWYLQALQTSSPSYPIMASLDLARRYMWRWGRDSLDLALANAQELESFLRESGAFRLPASRSVAYDWRDPLRILLQPQTISAAVLQRGLEAEGVFPEMVDPLQVLCLLYLGSSEREVALLKRVLQQMLRKKTERSQLEHSKIEPQKLAELWRQLPPGRLCFSLQQVQRARKKSISLERAVGEIAAENVIPYPPGIPLLMAGERVKEEHLALLRTLQRSSHVNFQGVKDLRLHSLQVISH